MFTYPLAECYFLLPLERSTAQRSVPSLIGLSPQPHSLLTAPRDNKPRQCYIDVQHSGKAAIKIAFIIAVWNIGDMDLSVYYIYSYVCLRAHLLPTCLHFNSTDIPRYSALHLALFRYSDLA
jgi:hypothetical protein